MNPDMSPLVAALDRSGAPLSDPVFVLTDAAPFGQARGPCAGSGSAPRRRCVKVLLTKAARRNRLAHGSYRTARRKPNGPAARCRRPGIAMSQMSYDGRPGVRHV